MPAATALAATTAEESAALAAVTAVPATTVASQPDPRDEALMEEIGRLEEELRRERRLSAAARESAVLAAVTPAAVTTAASLTCSSAAQTDPLDSVAALRQEIDRLEEELRCKTLSCDVNRHVLSAQVRIAQRRQAEAERNVASLRAQNQLFRSTLIETCATAWWWAGRADGGVISPAEARAAARRGTPPPPMPQEGDVGQSASTDSSESDGL